MSINGPWWNWILIDFFFNIGWWAANKVLNGLMALMGR